MTGSEQLGDVAVGAGGRTLGPGGSSKALSAQAPNLSAQSFQQLVGPGSKAARSSLGTAPAPASRPQRLYPASCGDTEPLVSSLESHQD